MTINLPHREDIQLGRPPLREVICQVRFVPLLSIADRMPTPFQEALRHKFPGFSVRRSVQLEAGPGGLQMPPGFPVEYEMKAADGTAEASLGINFVALTTGNYKNWRGFLEDLEPVLVTFEKVYGTIAATRVGLRFVNTLDAETTGLKKPEKLLALLRRDLTCLMRNRFWSPPQKAGVTLLLEEGSERMTLGVGFEAGHAAKILLDFDYFTELEPAKDLATQAILEMVDRFHGRLYDVFRWCLRDDKLHVFRPLQQPG
jgi:uncharacterized protein (TIGR04255 family)